MNLRDNFKTAAKELFGDPTVDKQAAKGAEEIKQPSAAAAEQPVQAKGKSMFGEVKQTKPLFDFESAKSTTKLVADAKGEFTVIARGAKLNGGITSQYTVDIRGEVTGDVASEQNLNISGLLKGNAAVENAALNSGRMRGSIDARGDVKVSGDSIIFGDITAENAVIDGKVKGNVTVRQTLTLGAKAAVDGKITANLLSMQAGAIFTGQLQISVGDVSAVFARAEKQLDGEDDVIF